MLRFSYGPGDITCVAIVPGAAYVLDEVVDFSVSTHADKVPIRRLGHRLPVGWSTGAITVAGTLVLAQMVEGSLWKLRRHAAAVRVYGEKVYTLSEGIEGADGVLESYATSILPQQLPPFHLIFVHANETGQMSIERLYDVVIESSGATKGVHNLQIEETYQYQAAFYEQIRLHRSLTYEEMVRLFSEQTKQAKQLGFASVRAKPMTLAEGLMHINPTILGLEEDHVQALLEETEFIEQKVLEGEATSRTIADSGEVLYTPSGVRAHRRPPESQSVLGSPAPTPISESVVGRDGEIITLSGFLHWNGNSLHVARGTQLVTPAEQAPLAIIHDVSQTKFEVPGSLYYRALLEPDASTASLFYVPDKISLVVDLSKTRVTRSSSAVSFSLLEDTESPGVYTGRYMGYDVTLDTTDVVVNTLTIGPLQASYPKGLPVIFGGSLQVEISVGSGAAVLQMSLVQTDIYAG
ncbi:MAG: hypothetical protein D6800_03220 [Candidatus Zixiibacteriota bacterium]|nr:MAG: hypothetical protein D6800_03220 [candidate division Zixibacteria bacterium]